MEKKEITTKFSTTPNRGTLQQKLQPFTVYHGRITCQICFVFIIWQKNIKRGNFQKLADFCRFKEVAEASEKVLHEYNKTNQMVNWQDFEEKWAHKACKGKFFNNEFLASQMQFVSTYQLLSEKDQQNNESVCETTKDVDTLRKSVWQQCKY